MKVLPMSNDNQPIENESDPFESVTDPSDTAEEFLQKLDLANDRWHEQGFWIFRGQNNAEWELMPSLFRNWDEGTRPGYEIALIENFLRTVNLAHLPIPSNSLDYMSHTTKDSSGATKRYLQYKSRSERKQDRSQSYDFSHVVFAIAQHSGIPTRLLDFTYDPLVAAYFAAEWEGLLDSLELSSQHLGDYFKNMFHKSRNSLDEAMMAWDEHSTKVRTKLAELPAELPGKMAVWAISASGLDDTTLRILDHPYSEILNLSVQKGIFLCETENYEVRGESWRSFNDKLSQLVESGEIYKLTLPCTERGNLLNLLRKKRISDVYLKPTYDSVAKAVVAETAKSG